MFVLRGVKKLIYGAKVQLCIPITAPRDPAGMQNTTSPLESFPKVKQPLLEGGRLAGKCQMNSTANPWLWVVRKEKGRERCRIGPDHVKEIIEASEIRLGLQLAKSIIANQFFDDLCPLLFGLEIAGDGTGIFTNSMQSLGVK